MFSVYKYSFLHQECSINPRLINRCVDRAQKNPVSDCFDQEPPFHRLCSERPHIPVEHIDVIRREQAFGRWALPKLYRELHSKDPIIVLRAVNSVCDMVHDPEKTFEAIRLKFVPRLGNLLMKTKIIGLQERILMALYVMADQALGRDEILNRPVLVNGFKDLLAADDQEVRCKTAAVLEMLSRSFISCCILIEEGYIPTLVQYILVDEKQVVVSYLLTLEKLFMHVSGQEEGIYYEALTKLVDLLDRADKEIVSLAANCLSMLVSHPDGKKISVEMELLIKLNKLLHSENRDVYTSAAEVIMFATHTVRSKHQAAAIEGLAIRLLALANDFNSPATQMFCMKALGNMCEHPMVRNDFVKNHLEEVEAIRTCEMEELQRYKEILLKIINWKPWIG